MKRVLESAGKALAPLALTLLAACAQAPTRTDAAAEPKAAEGAISAQDQLAFLVNEIRRGECADLDARFKTLPVNGFDNLDQTPLIAAVSQHQADCVRDLIAHGADVNLPDHAGWTPLIHAAYFTNDDSIMGQLIEHGARLDEQNNRGLTALYLASAAGHEPQVQLLLKKGADARLATQSGYTPVRVAQLRGLTRIVALLEGDAAAATPAKTP